jgi:hypothetical protein
VFNEIEEYLNVADDPAVLVTRIFVITAVVDDGTV